LKNAAMKQHYMNVGVRACRNGNNGEARKALADEQHLLLFIYSLMLKDHL
jgi:hypothetical protein